MQSTDSAGTPSLRPVGDADREFLSRLYASTRAAEMALVDWSDEQKQAFLQMQFHAQSSHYAEHFPKASFDIIEMGGESIGRLYLDEREDALHVLDIAILPEFQGRGIGGGYLRSIMDLAAASDRDVTIYVESNNPAMSLYRRLGFERVKDEGVYWFMRWTAQDPA